MSPGRTFGASLTTALVAAVLAACGGGSGGAGDAAARRPSTTAPTTVPTTTLPPTTAAPAYQSSVAPVTAADLGASWHPGCPVAPENLRMVTVNFWNFEGGLGRGQVVVHADAADAVVEVFRQLFDARFPIRKMKPIFTQAEFDDFETPDDNSTGFSCRNAVNSSSAPSWSQHAYGHAVDVNPIENPYLEGGRVIPSLGAAFTNRADVRPGMATADGVLVQAFRSVGWGWGASFRDYQHFSTNGR